MKTVIALALAFAFAFAFAGEPETWKPHEHPAVVERSITGFTAPARRLVLASEVGGRLTAVRFEAGDRVPADDADRVAFRVDGAAAAIARDRAAAGVTEAEAAVAALLAEAAVAARERDHFVAEHQRLAGVGVAGGIAERDLAAAAYAAEAAELGVAARGAGIERARAGVATARQALAQAEDHLRRHAAPAPAGWVVAARLQEPGAMVVPAQPVLHLVDVSELAVHLHLGEDEIARLGDEVRLTFPGRAGAAAPARIHHRGLEHAPRSFKRPVELRLRGADAPEASGGLEVRLVLRLPDPGKVLVPASYVTVRLEQAYVTDAAGELRPILPLRRQNGYITLAAADLPAGVTLRRPPPAGDGKAAKAPAE
jgi:HlyD family secretion protein